MHFPLKPPLFINKCSSKPDDLLYIFTCIVPLNYHFSLKNVPLNFTTCSMYLYSIVPLNYHFSKKCLLKLQYLLYIFISIVPLNYHFS